jgi:hypothetical protein
MLTTRKLVAYQAQEAGEKYLKALIAFNEDPATSLPASAADRDVRVSRRSGICSGSWGRCSRRNDGREGEGREPRETFSYGEGEN